MALEKLTFAFTTFVHHFLDRREAERGRFTNEAIRRFQLPDSQREFQSSKTADQIETMKTKEPSGWMGWII